MLCLRWEEVQSFRNKNPSSSEGDLLCQLQRRTVSHAAQQIQRQIAKAPVFDPREKDDEERFGYKRLLYYKTTRNPEAQMLMGRSALEEGPGCLPNSWEAQGFVMSPFLLQQESLRRKMSQCNDFSLQCKWALAGKLVFLYFISYKIVKNTFT